MSTQSITLLKWQFDLVWQLAQYHLPVLTDDISLWEPSKNSWNLRLKKDGKWFPDFSESEPDPIPTVTIGWITWQMLWYWQSAVNAVEGHALVSPEDVEWPGDIKTALVKIDKLKNEWEIILGKLKDTDLEKKIFHLWPEQTPLWQTMAWLNSELMKSLSEIGYIRFLYHSRTNPNDKRI